MLKILHFQTRIYFLFFILIFCIHNSKAQYSHFSQNFLAYDYKAGNQNWDISSDENGKIYVANNKGLLEFDGINWNLWELSNKTIIRSVLIDKDRIYVGSLEEFGFFYRTNFGKLEYKSLTEKLHKSKPLNDEEFWQIIKFENNIVFRSFSNIYFLKNNTIKRKNLPSTIMSCSVVDDKLFAATLNDGIFEFQKDKFESYFKSDEINNFRIVSITLYNKKSYIINTELNGAFILENNKLTPWNTEVNQYLIKHQLNRFTKLSDGSMVFGTIKNGVYITNSNGKIKSTINKENGLINNTILSQFVTSNKELWLGLDNGIEMIDLSTSNHFYNDLTGKLGAVYDVIKYKNIIYIATNTGVYYIDNENKTNFIEGTQGQAWSLTEIEGELFCGHNNGTFIINKNKIDIISNQTGCWIIRDIPKLKDSYIQATYTGLFRLEKVNKKWISIYLGKTSMPIKNIVFEDDYNAWIVHANKGLFKVKFDNKYNIIEIADYNKKGLFSNYNVRVHKLKNTISFFSKKGWQKYDAMQDSIIPFNYLNELIGEDTYIISKEESPIVALKSNNNLAISSSVFKNKKYIQKKFFDKRLVTSNENISRINDSVFALNLYDGFMLINLNKISSPNKVILPIVESISIDNYEINIKTDRVIIPYRSKNIRIAVSSPLSKDHFFEYAVTNINYNLPWAKSKNGFIELDNIPIGDYNLKIRTSNYSENKSEELMLNLQVQPPWYKSTLGYLLLVILLLIILFSLYQLHKLKIKNEKKKLAYKYEKRQLKLREERQLENEKEIIRIKNESLKNEIKFKSKQLANTALTLKKKNETLLLLKRELMLNKENFNNQYALQKLLKDIDRSVEGKDEWEIFENNFNMVNDDFFNQLKSNYPNLTPKELKICAYLKMNLTTKEIAPLLNISIRGMETSRYRLKKSLSLGEKDSLRGFLQKFY